MADHMDSLSGDLHGIRTVHQRIRYPGVGCLHGHHQLGYPLLPVFLKGILQDPF